MADVELVIFDADGTLVDHDRALERAWGKVKYLVPEMRTLGTERIKELWGMDFRTYWQDLVTGEITLDENRILRVGRMFDRLGIDSSREFVEKIARIYGAEYDSGIEPIAGASDAVTFLRRNGVRTAIVTNNIYSNLMYKLRKCGMAGLFDQITTPERLGILKPAREIFDEVLTGQDVDADHTVMVGDSFAEDIVGASNAGIRPVWFNRFRKARPEASFPFLEIHGYVPLGEIMGQIAPGFS